MPYCPHSKLDSLLTSRSICTKLTLPLYLCSLSSMTALGTQSHTQAWGRPAHPGGLTPAWVSSHQGLKGRGSWKQSEAMFPRARKNFCYSQGLPQKPGSENVLWSSSTSKVPTPPLTPNPTWFWLCPRVGFSSLGPVHLPASLVSTKGAT